MLTSAVSAEYGRFSGGVVNAVTKRGGNMFSGSVRSNLTNAAWTNETPFEKPRARSARARWISYYEGTFGGPLRENRAWFFFSGRAQSSNTSLTLAQTAGALPADRRPADRWDLKITAKPMTNQTVQGSISQSPPEQFAPSLPITIDPTAAITPTRRANLFVANWDGVLAQPLLRDRAVFAQDQPSALRQHQHAPAGLAVPTIGRVSPGGLHSDRSIFDRTDPEDRDNDQLTGSVSYFGSRRASARMTSRPASKCSRSCCAAATRSRRRATCSTPTTRPRTASADGCHGPRRAGLDSGRFTRRQHWLPTRGAELDITTTSFYLQDRWTLRSRLTLDLGLRYEHVRPAKPPASAPASARSRSCRAWRPRISCARTARRPSRRVVCALLGPLHLEHFGRNTPVGNAGRVTSVYNGPAGQGYDFAPGLRPDELLGDRRARSRPRTSSSTRICDRR